MQSSTTRSMQTSSFSTIDAGEPTFSTAAPCFLTMLRHSRERASIA